MTEQRRLRLLTVTVEVGTKYLVEHLSSPLHPRI